MFSDIVYYYWAGGGIQDFNLKLFLKRHRPGLVSPVVGVAFRFMNLEKGRHTYEATSKFIYRTSFSSSDI